MKLVMEAPVRKPNPSYDGHAARTWSASIPDWVRPIWARCIVIPDSNAARTVRGIADHLQHRGSFIFEQGNPDPSAEHAMFGKLPSPAMSRTGDGASVVVGARESRAHGEGRQ
jgi:hypothetical protein